MSSFLLDTNVVSELRKRQKMNVGVASWFNSVPSHQMFMSAITVGEIRRGIEEKRGRDPVQSAHLDAWMARTLGAFRGHLLPVCEAVADCWGRLNPGQPLPVADGLIAATAIAHDLVVVTRNEKDFRRAGCKLLNPWGD